jgi:outer membrane immunogenic protein
MTPDRHKSASRRLLAFAASWFVRDGPRPDCLLVILPADTNRRDRGPVVYARRFSVLTACTAALLLGSLQFGLAADLKIPAPERAPLPPEPFNWSGFYVGGELGFDFATAKYVRPQSTQSDIWIGSANRGLVGGVYAGFNYQALPWLVLGVEGDLSSSRAGYREVGPNQDFLQATKYLAAFAGRVGIVIMPATMVYAKAGPAWIDVRGNEGFTDTFTKTLRGELIAVGIEGLVTPNYALRLEGSYTHATETLLLNQGLDQYRPSIVQVMLGAEYKLDMPGLGVPAASPATGPLFTKAPPAVTSVNWTGVEAGAFGSVNGDQMRYSGPFVGTNDQLGPFANLAIGGGGFLGLNVGLYPNLVAGFEASANFQKADFNDAVGNGLSPRIVHFASISEIYALSLRFGWLATPSTLFYMKVGPAWIRVTPDASYWNAIAPNNNSTQPVTVDGYQYGGGAETYLTPHFSVRVEGVYTASFDAPRQLTFQGIQPTPYKLKPSLLTATLGAAVHF